VRGSREPGAARRRRHRRRHRDGGHRVTVHIETAKGLLSLNTPRQRTIDRALDLAAVTVHGCQPQSAAGAAVTVQCSARPGDNPGRPVAGCDEQSIFEDLFFKARKYAGHVQSLNRCLLATPAGWPRRLAAGHGQSWHAPAGARWVAAGPGCDSLAAASLLQVLSGWEGSQTASAEESKSAVLCFN
jgi:hypothetical protein